MRNYIIEHWDELSVLHTQICVVSAGVLLAVVGIAIIVSLFKE